MSGGAEHEAAIEVLKEAMRVFKAKDVEALQNLLDDDFKMTTHPADPVHGLGFIGAFDKTTFFTHYWKFLDEVLGSDVEYGDEDYVAMGDKVVLFTKFSAAPRPGPEPLQAHGVLKCVVKDGKIVYCDYYIDCHNIHKYIMAHGPATS